MQNGQYIHNLILNYIQRLYTKHKLDPSLTKYW